MKHMMFAQLAVILGLGWAMVGCEGGEGPIVPPPPAPAEYADKHMPADWWADEKIVEEGRTCAQLRRPQGPVPAP